MPVDCRGCGTTFMPDHPAQKRCQPKCNYSRPERRPRSRSVYKHGIRFIGVDGEGVTNPDGSHDYVLLSVGDATLHKHGARLSYIDIFPFLYRQFVLNPDAAFVGFYLTYDFSQWFRALPEERARMLLTEQGRAARLPKSVKNPTPYPVRYEGWEFDILGLRRFKLRPHNNTKAPWMFICDAGPFWQTSFLSAIDPKTWTEPVTTPEQYVDILAGKAHRATAVLDQHMIRYNITENLTLGELMSRLNEGFLAQGWQLKKSQWFGPGQAAEVWLRSIDAPTREQIVEATPKPVLAAAQASYYGGWFEIPRHGTVPGTSYEYDINSAYPQIISELPCLLHGEWLHDKSHIGTGIHLVNVTTTGSNPYLGGLPHRDKNGIIARPSNVTGWYWWGEVDTALQAGLISDIVINESWSYIPCDCPRPFASIRDLYNQRIAIGKNTPHGKALKLVYNSAYGKFAQSIASPRFANAIYASLITSGCRTMILNAIGTHPNGAKDVLMVATDGVYFRTPHPTLPLDGNRLGAWDDGTKENLTLFMPGVYWDDKARKALQTDTTVPLKSRGINGRQLASWLFDIDLQFKNGMLVDGWPYAEIPVLFSVISPKLALARGRWDTCGRIITDGSKVLSADPVNKRDVSKLRLEDGLLTTSPYTDLGVNHSYTKSFGNSIESAIDNDVLITDDGSINRELYELLTGD